MEEILKIEEYDEVNKAYEDIVKRSYALVEKVAKRRGIILDKRTDDDIENFHNIIFKFKRTTTYFNDVIFLMETLTKWNVLDEDGFEEEKSKKIQNYIKLYNGLVVKLNYYKKSEELLKEKDYSSVRSELEKKFIELFKEMFKYKNKEYDLSWSFCEWCKNISLYYDTFSYDLSEMLEEVYGRGIVVNSYDDYYTIEANEIEKIADMNFLYLDMLNYKKYD